MIPTDADVGTAQLAYERADAAWMASIRAAFGTMDAWLVRYLPIGQGTEVREAFETRQAAEAAYLRVWTAYCAGKALAA